MNHPKQKGKKVPEQLNTTLNMAKKYKKKAIKKILRREAKEKDEYETGALLPNGLPRKWRFCGFKDCDYRTQYKANLNRHQNHYGHRDVRLNEDAEVEVVEVVDEIDVPVRWHVIWMHWGSAGLLLEGKLQGKPKWK